MSQRTGSSPYWPGILHRAVDSPDLPATAGSVAPDELRHRRALRLRQSLVVTLAVVSGATDAIGLLVLGGAFTSVMTGNMVLLGVAASSTDGTLAASAGFSILAFCAGAALGARLAGIRPRRATACGRAGHRRAGGRVRVRGRLRGRLVGPRHTRDRA